MVTREYVQKWIAAHNAYDWEPDRIAENMLLEAVKNATFSEDAYPGIKELLVSKIKGSHSDQEEEND